MSSVDEAARETVPERLGSSFRLLLHVRVLITAMSVVLLPAEEITPRTLLPATGLAFLYWFAARNWRRITPYLYDHPLLTGADLFVCFAVLAVEGPVGPFFLATVIASSIAGLLFRWRGMLIVAGAQIICYFAAFGYYTLLHDLSMLPMAGFQTLVAQPAYYPVIGAVGVMLRRLFDEQAELAAMRREAELRTAAADERARLAREMHDSLAKTLRGIAMSAQALPAWLRKSPERAALEVQRIAASAEVASREARGLIADLRDDQVQQPLVITIRTVVERWSEDAGIAAELELDDAAELPLVARYEFVAIVKEALANIERHANASSVQVLLVRTGSQVSLTVRDDGRGFDVDLDDPGWLDNLAREGHYGVVGMHERAKRAAAVLTVRSNGDQGTTLNLIFAGDGAHGSAISGRSDEREAAEAG